MITYPERCAEDCAPLSLFAAAVRRIPEHRSRWIGGIDEFNTSVMAPRTTLLSVPMTLLFGLRTAVRTGAGPERARLIGGRFVWA